MFRILKKKKIYTGYDVKKFCQIKEVLDLHEIKYETTVCNSTQERMSRNILFGGDPLILNRIGIESSSVEYTIWVDRNSKEDFDELLKDII